MIPKLELNISNKERWKEDYHLINWDSLTLFDEYLEMGKLICY